MSWRRTLSDSVLLCLEIANLLLAFIGWGVCVFFSNYQDEEVQDTLQYLNLMALFCLMVGSGIYQVVLQKIFGHG
jgi:hypothetical protein